MLNSGLMFYSYLFSTSGKGSLPLSRQGKLYNVDNFNPTHSIHIFLLIGLLYTIS